MTDTSGLTDTPCYDCGRPVSIYLPEDGGTAWRCGRCAHAPVAQPVTPEAEP